MVLTALNMSHGLTGPIEKTEDVIVFKNSKGNPWETANPRSGGDFFKSFSSCDISGAPLSSGCR